MILSPKWQQTYEEALQAMKDTTYSQYSLADVFSADAAARAFVLEHAGC